MQAEDGGDMFRLNVEHSVNCTVLQPGSDICLLYWGQGKKAHELIPTHPLATIPSSC
jgi:hypothetical protein